LASLAENFQFFSGSEAFQKALLLLLLRDVQEELHHDDSIVREVLLESADVLETLLPDAPLVTQLGRQLLLS